MDTLRQNYFPICVAYILISGLLISLALLCYPNGRTMSFWTWLGILEVTLLVVFLSVSVAIYAMAPDKFSYRSGGPAAGLMKLALYYVVALVVLMAVGAGADLAGFGDYVSYLKLGMLILVPATCGLAAYLHFNRSSKDSAEDALATQGDGPRNLAALIRSTERKIKESKTTQPLRLRMDGLREDFQFRLPVGGKVLVHPKYKELAVKVRRLMKEITEDPDETMCADWIRKLEDYRTEAELIRMEVKM